MPRAPALPDPLEPFAPEATMSDSKRHRGGQDRQRINLHEPYELRDWAQSLGVSIEAVRRAVAAVGDRADQVRQHLQSRPSAAAVRSASAGIDNSSPSTSPDERPLHERPHAAYSAPRS